MLEAMRVRAFAALLALAGAAHAEPALEAHALLRDPDPTAEEPAEPLLARVQQALDLLELASRDGRPPAGEPRSDAAYALTIVHRVARGTGDTALEVANAARAERLLGAGDERALRMRGEAERAAGHDVAAARAFAARVERLPRERRRGARLDLVEALERVAVRDRRALPAARAAADALVAEQPSDAEARAHGALTRALAGEPCAAGDAGLPLLALLSRAMGGAFALENDTGLADAELVPTLAQLAEARRAIARLLGAGPEAAHPLRVRAVPPGTLALLAPPWACGLHRDGAVLLAIGRGVSPERVRSAIYHELAHAASDERAGGRCPRWLGEGLAMQLDGWPAAERAGSPPLLDWGELENPARWTGEAEVARTVYVESRAIAARLVERHGWPGMVALLERLRYGRNLETAWREALGEPFPASPRDYGVTAAAGDGAGAGDAAGGAGFASASAALRAACPTGPRSWSAILVSSGSALR